MFLFAILSIVIVVCITPSADAFSTRRANRALSTMSMTPLTMSLYRDFFGVEDRLFDSIFQTRSPVIKVVQRDPWSMLQREISPSPKASFNIDYIENTDGSLEIKADLPGFKKQDITLEIKDNSMILKVKKLASKNLDTGSDMTTDVEPEPESEAETKLKAAIKTMENGETSEEAGLGTETKSESQKGRSTFDGDANTNENVATEVINDCSLEQTNANANTTPRVIWTERTSFEGTRTIQLPNDFDEANISASLEDGVLTVNVPRIAPTKPAKRMIDIN